MLYLHAWPSAVLLDSLIKQLNDQYKRRNNHF